MIPHSITSDHILRALHEIDLHGVPPRRDSRQYYLRHGASLYPPKYVLSLATRYATGQELPVRGINVVGNAADLIGLGGIPAVYHGVNQTTAHSDDEYVVAADLVRAARVYAATAIGYLNEQGSR